MFGEARLVTPDGRVVPCAGRAVALLAYLAVEGPAPRSRLAGMLWPERREAAARNNLVQLLRRMANAYGENLVVGQDTLALSGTVRADVQPLLASGGGDAAVPGGEFLAGAEFGDAPDFAEWVTVQRERLDAVRVRRLAAQAGRLERGGEFAPALAATRRWLALHPLSEEGHRQAMRLHYLLGDRDAALAAYEACVRVLEENLRTAPLAETRELADLIARGRPVTRPPTAPTPPALARPAALVGREREWGLMEEGWRAGQLIVVSGEAGTGKSRLAHDFAASKGTVLALEGRPGDRLVPFSATVRNIRRILARGTVELPGWARHSLSWLLPELAPPGEARREADARLTEAIQLAWVGGLRGVDVCVFDDFQYVDDATLEAGFVLVEAVFPLGRSGGIPHSIAVHRRDQLPPAMREVHEGMVRAGQAVWVEVGALGEGDVRELLDHLGVSDGVRRAPDLLRRTGGNPLLVLETLRDLNRTGRLDEPEAALTVPERVGQLVARRLERVSRTGLQIARAAGVLEQDFSPELVADVLGAPLLDVLAAWEELEDAHILRGERFEHDLILEAVRAGVSPTVRQLLHRGAARALERQAAPPARLARHWQEGGRPGEAAPLLVRAAREAFAAARPAEALAFSEQAARLFGDLGEAEAAFDARAAALDGAWRHERPGQLGALVERLLSDARTPGQQVWAHLAQATWLLGQNRAREAEAAAARGLALLGGDGPSTARAALLRELLLARARQGQGQGARDLIPEVEAAHASLGDAREAAALDAVMGDVLLSLGQHEAASERLERALTAHEAAGDAYQAARLSHALAVAAELLGQWERAVALRVALDERSAGSSSTLRLWNALRLGTLHLHARQYGRALQWLRQAEALGAALGESGGLAQRALAEVFWALGDLGGCEHAVEAALAAPDGRDVGRGVLWLLRGLVWARRGDHAQARDAYGRAEDALRGTALSYSRGRLLLARAELEAGAQALPLVEEARRIADAEGHEPLVTAVLAARAEVLLSLGRPDEALADSTLAVDRLGTHPPREDYARPLLVHHEVLTVLGRPDADAPLREALDWLADMVRDEVPQDSRAMFLHEHVTHRALLAAAERTGLNGSPLMAPNIRVREGQGAQPKV